MTDTRAESSLSPAELVVLACLSQKKEPSDDELANVVNELCLPDAPPAQARAAALAALATLQQRALVSLPEAAKGKAKSGKRKPTTTGVALLRSMFGGRRAPTWKAVHDNHLPSLGLGLALGANAAIAAVGSVGSVVGAVLGARFGFHGTKSATAACDALIAERLGLPPGKLTMDGIRSHCLAERAGVQRDAGENFAHFAQRVASENIGVSAADVSRKETLLRALSRRALNKDDATTATRVGYSVLPASALARTSQPVPLHLVPSPAAPMRRSTPTGSVPPPPHELGTELLDEVQEALRQIGADGRFGAEKVFVSALWERITEARRAGLSLDGFKRWLLNANREGRLILARADLIGAMDPKRVAESEIRDVGRTFHFVLDARRGEPASHGGNHV